MVGRFAVGSFAAIALLLAGCATPQPHNDEGLSLGEALARATEEVPSDWSLFEARAQIWGDANGAQGRSDSWELRYMNSDRSQFRSLRVFANKVEITASPLEAENHEFLCSAAMEWDSTRIAAELGSSPQWRYVWDEARAKIDPQLGDASALGFSCLAGATAWHWSTPLMQNVDSTYSSRVFQLSVDGVLASFTPDDRDVPVSQGKEGLSVAADRLAFQPSGRLYTQTATFNTSGVTRVAIHLENYQEIPLAMPNSNILVTDPAGHVHQMPGFSITNTAPAMEILDVTPEAATGAWHIEVMSDAPVWPELNGDICTGVPAPESTHDTASCNVLA